MRAFSLILSLWLGFAFHLESGFAAEKLIVFTPSSLSDVMGKIAREFEQVSKQKVVLSIAGTSQLARQLNAGAPADLFISADQKWMDWVSQKGLIVVHSRKSFAGNRLVVAVRNETENWADAHSLLTQYSFAMAEPDTVPAGQYAREALTKKGWWAKAKDHAVFGENVRVTLRRVVLGEVGAAIVYGTDVLVEPGVKSLLVFPNNSHTPIAYWVARTPEAAKGANKFLEFLGTSVAGSVFAKAGFLPPPIGR
ncbi:MAG: molybdate ABC transporter substrate-binding protein [Rhizobiaceae bacterium]